jgi:hypothetical protein
LLQRRKRRLHPRLPQRRALLPPHAPHRPKQRRRGMPSQRPYRQQHPSLQQRPNKRLQAHILPRAAACSMIKTDLRRRAVS